MTFHYWKSFEKDIEAFAKKMLKYEVKFVSIRHDEKGYTTDIKCGKPYKVRRGK